MSFRAVLRRSGFRNLWLAQSVSRLGDSIHEIALLWIVYEVTGDPVLMSVVLVASLLPLVLTALPAGSLVDRWDRKRVLVTVNLARGAAVLGIPVVGTHAPAYLVGTVVAVAFVTGLMEAFAGPARNAIIPNLVPEDELDAANSLSKLTSSLSRLLYALGGVVVATIGVFNAFYVDAATFLVAAAFLSRLPAESGVPAKDGETTQSRLLDVREGVSFIRTSPSLPSLVVLSVAAGFVLAPLGIAIPVFAGDVLGLGSAAFGYLYAAIYAGVFVGGIVVGVSREVSIASRGTLVLMGTAGMGVGLGATAFVPALSPFPVLVAVLGLVGFGIAVSVVQIQVQTIAQASVPDEKRGRVFSVLTVVGLVAPPVSVVVSGPVLAAIGPEALFLLQGGAMVVLAVGLRFTPLGTPSVPAAEPA